MTTTDKTNKVEHKTHKLEEIVESPEVLRDEIEFNATELIEKNGKLLAIVGGALLFAVLAFVGYQYYTKSQNEEAQVAMINAVHLFEADSLKKALQGDGNSQGLVEIADNYGSTDAGNLACYYAGAAFLKQGKFDDAISYLDRFSSSDLLVQGRAYVLTGDAYMEKADYANAASYYKKGANYEPNKFFTPIYLMKLALASEKNKDYKAAVEAYAQIEDKYPTSQQANDAKKYKALAEELVGE
jgi:TolA-binding protein